jgi:hypothetical protein
MAGVADSCDPEAQLPGGGFCPTSWNQVSTGKYIIDPKLLLANTTASKCAVCKQPLLSTKKGCLPDLFQKIPASKPWRLRHLQQSEKQWQKSTSVPGLRRALGRRGFIDSDHCRRFPGWMGRSTGGLVRAHRAHRLMAPAESVSRRRSHWAAVEGCKEQRGNWWKALQNCSQSCFEPGAPGWAEPAKGATVGESFCYLEPS